MQYSNCKQLNIQGMRQLAIQNGKLPSLFLIALLLFLTSVPAMATLEQQRNMLDQLDQLDHQEFLVLTEKAYSCIQSRDFACAESKLAKAGKYLTNPQDRKTLNVAKMDLAAERRYEKEELVAAVEHERQAQLDRQRAAEAEMERQRRDERAQQEASNNNLVKGLFAIGTGTYIGSVTKNTSLGVAAAKSVYTGDTEAFNAAVDQAKAEREQAYNVKMAAIREQRARERDERAELARKERKVREEQAVQARREREERIAAEQQAQKAKQMHQTPQATTYFPQQVAISSWSQSCPPGYSPARHDNGVNVAAASGAYCIKDQQKVALQAVDGSTVSAGVPGASKKSSKTLTGASKQQDPGQVGTNDLVAGKNSVNTPLVGDTLSGNRNNAKVLPMEQSFNKIPNDPPRGTAQGGKIKGFENYNRNGATYSCKHINEYAVQYGAAADQLTKAYQNAPYKSNSRCQAKCDLLIWREEIQQTFHYKGDWSCTDKAIGLWYEVDGPYSSYNDGHNDDHCTCVTSGFTPILFSKPEKY